MAPGEVGEQAEPAREAVLKLGLQRVVFRVARRIQISDAGVDRRERTPRRVRRARVGRWGSLVDVAESVKLGAFRSHIGDLQQAVGASLILRREMPLQDVGRAHVGIHREQRRRIRVHQRIRRESLRQEAQALHGAIQRGIGGRQSARRDKSLPDEVGRIEARAGIRIRAVLRGVVENPEGAADHQLRSGLVCEAHARGEVVEVGMYQAGGRAVIDLQQLREGGGQAHVAAGGNIQLARERVEVGLRLETLLDDPEKLVAQAEIHGELMAHAPVVLHERRIVLARVIHVVQVVDAAPVRLSRQHGRQPAAAGSGLRRVVRVHRPEVQITAGSGGLKNGELLRPEISAEFPGLPAANHGDGIRDRVGVLDFQRWKISWASQVRGIAEGELRQASVIGTLREGHTRKTDLGGYIRVVVLLETAGPQTVVPQAQLVHARGTEDMRLADGRIVAVEILDAREEPAAIRQPGQRRGDQRWRAGHTEPVESVVLARENLVDAHIALIAALLQDRVGNVVVAVAVGVGRRKQGHQLLAQRILARSWNHVGGRTVGVIAERHAAVAGRRRGAGLGEARIEQLARKGWHAIAVRHPGRGSQIELGTEIATGLRRCRHKGRQRLALAHPQALVVTEEEQLVANQASAQGGAKLVLLVRWQRRIEEVARIHFVVAQELV